MRYSIYIRKIPGLPVYGVAQPTTQGIDNVIQHVLQEKEQSTFKVCWINLREEPLIYINGMPYVLRDQYFTLRNIKSYSGITGARLELMESKLKEDVINELRSYEQRILLHTETKDGVINSVWEVCVSSYGNAQ